MQVITWKLVGALDFTQGALNGAIQYMAILHLRRPLYRLKTWWRREQPTVAQMLDGNDMREFGKPSWRRKSFVVFCISRQKKGWDLRERQDAECRLRLAEPIFLYRTNGGGISCGFRLPRSHGGISVHKTFLLLEVEICWLCWALVAIEKKCCTIAQARRSVISANARDLREFSSFLDEVISLPRQIYTSHAPRAFETQVFL
jgi:hypothetical protein